MSFGISTSCLHRLGHPAPVCGNVAADNFCGMAFSLGLWWWRSLLLMGVARA